MTLTGLLLGVMTVCAFFRWSSRRLTDRQFDAAYAETVRKYGLTEPVAKEATPAPDVASYITDSLPGLLEDGEGWVVAGLEVPLAEELLRRGYRLAVIDGNAEYVHVARVHLQTNYSDIL